MKRLAYLFGMTENERKGFLILSILLGLIALSPFVYRTYLSSIEEQDKLHISARIVHERKTSDGQTGTTNSRPVQVVQEDSHKKERSSELFMFDPNQLPVEQWKRLGFTEKQIQVIKNYESKGGHFRTKADLAKIYVVSEEKFERLAPYVTLPEHVPDKVRKSNNPVKIVRRKATTIDMASADTLLLQDIDGIGPVLASRIVKFREALGGFHSTQQVKEVYGISAEQFEAMHGMLVLGSESIRKLAINSLSAEQLAEHPYISKKVARHIVRYREQHGVFTSLVDLEGMYALDADFLRKIAPYLDFN